MLLKLGTLTYPSSIDDDEFIEQARKQILPKEESFPIEIEEIYQTIQTLYFDSDTHEFYRGYTNPINLHYNGNRYFIKKLILTRDQFHAMNWNGFTIEVNGGLFNLYRCGNYLS